ncbi:MAG: tRNA (adenosine(37)-N6)-threonylcarbamoyltransferase complex ATPase subunit type 1 TsaE [Alphaproteobacteria bacterium]|nr:tRNA (adenosine(37)-N6)-threonylcarbamoyltransferase complex ATPase subunit type 1 TsaE [Alphaproteobacteria bacterium]
MTAYLHPTITIALPDAAATAALGQALATLVCAGDLVRLQGPMGAGKTTLVQQILAGLGWHEAVTSPTYTLLQTYRTVRFNVAHVDCYRLGSPAELVPLGLEAFRQFGVVLAEWAERGGDLLAPQGPHGGDLLGYHINSLENPGVLTVTLQGEGDGPRTAVLQGSPSWQRRFGLLPGLGITADKPLTRGKSEAQRRVFLDGLGLRDYNLQSQSGDWSGRSYARVRLADGTTRMLMDSPPPIETVAEYVQVADYYRSLGLVTAKIYGQDAAEGYLLTDDFGDRTLWHAMGAKGPDDGAPIAQTPWFTVAAQALVRQVQSTPPAWGRAYTRTDWWVEGVRLVNWYLPFATGQACTLEDYARWQQLLMPLYDVVDSTPRGLMQWDCQSPNSMILGSDPTLANYALIDIQDARVAPVAQDVGLLVRNIRTARYDADEEAVIALLVEALRLDEPTLRRAVAVGAWHHMVRILGGLTRLAVRDGRPGPAQAYLRRTWEVAEQCAHDPYAREILGPAWAFMAPYKEPGLAKLASLKTAA